MNDEFKNDEYSWYKEGLTKKEKRKLALKIARAREKMLKDIMEHNERIMEESETIYEEENFFFFDLEHPFVSLLANWWGNSK